MTATDVPPGSDTSGPGFPLHIPHGWAQDRRLSLAALGLLIRTYDAWRESGAEDGAEIELVAEGGTSIEILHQELIDAGYIRNGELVDPFHIPRPPAQRPARQRRETAEERFIREGSIVYYLRRRSNGLIKIGMTKNWDDRSERLYRQFGPIELLATEPGARLKETQRHRQFQDCRVTEFVPGWGSEWFRPTYSLMSHIRDLAAAAGRSV